MFLKISTSNIPTASPANNPHNAKTCMMPPPASYLPQVRSITCNNCVMLLSSYFNRRRTKRRQKLNSFFFLISYESGSSRLKDLPCAKTHNQPEIPLHSPNGYLTNK